MNSYVTGSTIKNLREANRLTQRTLAERIGVSDKAVSKWETGRGGAIYACCNRHGLFRVKR